MKIAQRAKVKLSIDDYIKRTKQKTKSGGDMSRMAHLELVMKNKLNVNLGDVIYYVNNGKKASDGDVQKINKPKKGWTQDQIDSYKESFGKEPLDNLNSMIKLNCYMLDSKTIEDNPNLTGDYNVPRSVSTFNKRIEPLLVVFKEEIRDSILVDNPEERSFYTKEQCELINGVPFEEGDQDSLEDLLTISPEELKFWEEKGMSPDHIYDLAEPGWEKFI